MVELPLALIGHLRRWHKAGIPNANVLPLPVSAIPTMSLPSNAGGQVHACIGVGSLNPANADWISGGTSSCENFITGVMAATPSGVCKVMECFSKNALASAGEMVLVLEADKVKYGFVEEVLDSGKVKGTVLVDEV